MDSDSDCLSPNNLLNYPKENTMIRLKGPQYESTRSLNPGINNLPRNFEKQRMRNAYGDTEYVGHRPSSPMSFRSTSERLPRRDYGHSLMPPNNVHQSFYNGGYAHSYVNGRPGSPTMSMMSLGSNMSVTADVIVSALKTMKFNKYELHNIKEAYHKLIKGRVRKRIAKRRNIKMFLKGARRVSGGESGDQGSDSSISSDDCRSTRTGVTMHGGYRNYAPSVNYHKSGRNSDDARSVKTDFTDLRKTIRDQNVYRDCSGDLKQNSFKNMFNLGRRMNNTGLAQCNMSAVGPAHSATMNTTQRDRFKSSFMLPSQRFNKSVAPSIMEESRHLVNQDHIPNQTNEKRFKSSFLLPSQRFNKTSNTIYLKENKDNIIEKRSRAQSPILTSKYSKKASKRDVSDNDEDLCNVTVLEKTNKTNNLPKSSPIKRVNSPRKRIETAVKMVDSSKAQTAIKRILSPEHKTNKLISPKHRTKPRAAAKKTIQSQTESNNKIAISQKSQRKRSLNGSSDSVITPAKNKITKHTTPEKITTNKNKTNLKELTKKHNHLDNEHYDFIFAKPAMPMKKPANTKANGLKVGKISQSKVEEPVISDEVMMQHKESEKENIDEEMTESLYNSDLSMRPSFLKRKLFTQTLDVTESKNVSTESSPTSPQKQKLEKNKTRKLVSSSSYMSREVADDSNLLDLIHKIVPPDRMNITQQKPQRKTTSNQPKQPVADDKWDISSIITNNDMDEGSDTFTNEDIFETTDKDFTVKPKKVKEIKQKPNKNEREEIIVKPQKAGSNKEKACVVVLNKENLTDKGKVAALNLPQQTVSANVKPSPEVIGRSVFQYANKFWNCDSESDAPETPIRRSQRIVSRVYLLPDNKDEISRKKQQKIPELTIAPKRKQAEPCRVQQELKKCEIPQTINRKLLDTSISSKRSIPEPAPVQLRPNTIKEQPNNVRYLRDRSFNMSKKERTVQTNPVKKIGASEKKVRKLQDMSITPTRQSTRLKLKHNSSSEMTEAINDLLKRGSKNKVNLRSSTFFNSMRKI